MSKDPEVQRSQLEHTRAVSHRVCGGRGTFVVNRNSHQSGNERTVEICFQIVTSPLQYIGSSLLRLTSSQTKVFSFLFFFHHVFIHRSLNLKCHSVNQS